METEAVRLLHKVKVASEVSSKTLMSTFSAGLPFFVVTV